MSSSVVAESEAGTDRPARNLRVDSHSGQHMGGRHLAGRAGGARGDRDPLEVERDQRHLGLDARDREQHRVRHPLGAGLPKITVSGEMARRPACRRSRKSIDSGLLAPEVARDGGRCGPESHDTRQHSRCRREGRAPARHRGSSDARGAAASLRRTRAPTPWGRRSCAPKGSEDRRLTTLISSCIRPAAWTASTCSSPPAACTISARLRDRLDHAGLVVGEHDRDQRAQSFRRVSREPALQRSRGRLAPPRSPERCRPHAARSGRRSRTDGCSIADTSSRSQPLATSVGPGEARRQRHHVRLGAARREHDVARLGADQRGDLLARLLDQVASRPALAHAPTRDCRSPSSADITAARASGRSGAVAFQSRYVRSVIALRLPQ